MNKRNIKEMLQRTADQMSGMNTPSRKINSGLIS
jgi:hypothetical protein